MHDWHKNGHSNTCDKIHDLLNIDGKDDPIKRKRDDDDNSNDGDKKQQKIYDESFEKVLKNITKIHILPRLSVKERTNMFFALGKTSIHR